MKKKWNKPAQFKRALAILFTAVLIFQAIPMQSAISMTANAEETTAGTQEDKKENSQNSGEENSKEKSNSGEDKKESDQQDTSKEGDSDSNKDGDSSSGKENTGDTTSGDGKEGDNSASEDSGKDNSSTEGTGNDNSSGDSSSDSTEGSSNTNTSEGEDKKDGENAGGSSSGQEGTAGGSGDSTGGDGTSGDTSGNGGGTGESGNTDASGNGGSNESSGKTGTGTDGQTPSGDNGNTNTDGGTTGDNQGEQTPAAEETKEVTISYKGCRAGGSGDYTTKKEIHSNKSSVEFKFEVGGPEDTVLQYQLVSDGDEKKDDGWKAADDNNETFTISSQESYETPKSLYVRAYSKSLSKGKEYADDGKAISLDFDLEAPKLTVEPAASDKKIESKEDVTYTVTATDNKDYTVYKSTVNAGSGAPSADVSNEEVWKNAGTKDTADDENNIEVTFGTEGEYDVYFIAVDKAGNTSDVVKAQSHLIDKTEPVVTLAAPPEASNNFKVTVKAEDKVSNNFASGLKKDFSYVLNQGEEKLKEGNGELSINEDGKGTGVISFDDLEADGKYTLTVTVNDQVGNPGKGSVELDFDQNKPEVTISIDQSDSRKDDNGIFHYRTQDLKDNSSTISFEKSKGNGVLTKVSVILIPDESISDATTYTYKPDIKEEEKKKITVPLADVIGEIDKIGDGTWTIYAYAEDSAGNSVGNEAGAGDGAKKLATVIVDDTAPVPALGEPVVVDEKTETVTKDGKTYFNGAVTVTATTDSSKEANGEKLVWTIGDSSALTDGTKTFSPSGENVAEALPETVFVARDLAGNEGSATFQKSEDEKYYFDLLAPVITYTVAGADNLTIVGDKDTFEYKITINDETISCGIDSASIQYAIINSDDPNAKPADKDWIKNVGVTEKDSGIYTFSVTSPGKGVVYIRAFDKLKNEAETVKANVLVMEKVKPIITSVTVTTQKADSEEVTKTYDNPTGNIKVEEMPVNTLKVSVSAEDKPDDTYSGLKTITYTLTGTKSDNTPYVSVKPKELSKKTPSKLSDLEKTKTTDAVNVKDLFDIPDELSGTFTLSISVTDNCGNTSDVQTIELELDNTLPVISVDITPSKLVDFPTYHNAENSEVIVEIIEKNISYYEISVGDVSIQSDKDHEGVTKETNGDVTTVTFSSDVVKDENSEGEIVITAEAKDKANNSTKTFSNSDAWVYLQKKSDEKASFILDTIAPIATIQYATDGKNKPYAYNEKLVSGGPDLSAYYSGDITPSITVEETNEIKGALTANFYIAENLSSFPTSGTALTFDKSTDGIWNAATTILTGDSCYAYYTLQGTDRAGNALVVNEAFADAEPESGKKETITEKKVENKDTNGSSYTSLYLLVIDKKAPIANILYTTDGTNKPYAYNEQLVSGGPGLSAYYSGDITPSITVEESNKIDDQTLTANSYGAADLSSVPTSETKLTFAEDTSTTSTKRSWKTEILKLTGDSYYAYYTLQGTDRAGNALVVNEAFTDTDPESGKKETITEKKVENKDTNGSAYTSLYLLVIDKKVPIANILYTTDGTNKPYAYNEKLVSKGPGLSAYYSGDITPSITVEESNKIDDQTLTANSYGAADLSSVPASETKLIFNKSTDGIWNAATTILTGDSCYAYYTLQGTDRAGNALVVNEAFADADPESGKKETITEKKVENKDTEGKLYTSLYMLVVDKVAPEVSKIMTFDQKEGGENDFNHGNESVPPYYNDEHTFYYNAENGIQTVYSINDRNVGSEDLQFTYTYEGTETTINDDTIRKLTKISEEEYEFAVRFVEEGCYQNIYLSGKDKAGNNIVKANSGLVIKGNKDLINDTGDQNAVLANAGDDSSNNNIELTYSRILDRVSPVATIEHVIPDNTTGYLYPEKENESTATMYSNHAVKTIIQVEDTYGKSETPVYLDGEKLSVKKHFRKAGELFAASDAENWAKEPGSSDPLKTEITTTQEGHYTFSISGTDRAGNPVIVNEKLVTNKDKNAVTENKGGFGGDTPSKKAASPYNSFYALVYDCTAPVYRLTINNPSNLEETFDEKTSIAYYGKSVSAINAKYVVTDYNFDDTRIKAGITSESASGVNNMDSLSPSWTKPETKGSAKTDKDSEVTTATFNLTVSVDGQHEGIHRFEIEGCDKAGNFLAQSSEQVTVDNSTKRADLAAKTVAQDASKGKFWTQRKAVDVSAPKGALKVRSSKDSSDNYYELQFEPGQNTPKKYDPARKETSAYVIVESDDCSPTKVYYNLRSEDSSKDAAYKKDNPLVSSGNNAYKNDNSRAVTVNGEQAFYLENIIIKDRAGNVRANDSDSKYTLAKSNHIYLDVTPPAASEIKDAEAPQVKIVADGSFTRHEADGERYIYKPDGDALDLKVTVTDPGGKERSSGINKIQLEIEVGGTDRLKETNNKKEMYIYTPPKDFKDRDGTLKYEIKDLPISLPKGGNFESNDITVRVTAWDNSNNKSTPSKDGGLLKLGIDTTAPTAIVTYQDTVQPQHDKYFKADRVVEIAIYDRNVDNGKINISTNTNVPGSFTAPHENKTTDGGDDGNKDKWTKTLHYDVDGDYTLQLSGTDALGNKLTDIKWNGPAPNEFTVDKTQPVIRINLPTEVNSQDGVKYYDSAATASIEIQEHNFFEETDSSLLNVTIEPANHSGAEAPANPGRSAFSNSGTDMHVSTVDCTQDGDYEVTASYTDMAGNQAVVQGGEGKKSDQEAWSGKFVIDTVVPTLKMDPTTFNVDKATGDPLKDLADQIYTRKDFAPRVIINDINYDEANSNFEVKAYGANVRNEDLTEKAGDVSKGEYNIQFKNFEMVRDMDGVYKVTAVATDLAKHQATLDFLFSVNRFGSTYVYADEATESKVTRYYIKDTEEPLKILELSPVELKTHTAELFKDHNRNTLAEDTQYTFNPAKGSTSVGTNGEGHRVYEYTIAPEVYEEEGVYDFILSSTDAAGNENSTTLFRDGSVKDGEIEQVRFPINFQVDKTVPVNRLTGVESDKEQFNTDQLEIMVYPEDYQTDIGEVEVKIWDGSKNGANAQENKEKYLHYRTIREDEDVQKLAQEHVYPIEDAKAGIPVTLEDKGSWQLLEVITTDLAGNKSTDYRTEDLSVNIIESRRPFLVTTNPLIQFYNFKPALYGTTGGIALLLFLLFFWKRRKEEKKGGEAA